MASTLMAGNHLAVIQLGGTHLTDIQFAGIQPGGTLLDHNLEPHSHLA